MAYDPEDEEQESSRVTIIFRSSGWSPLTVREVWAYRELVYFLVWSEIKVRYKQTVLGAAWAIIQPFVTMVVFTIFFGRLANIASEGIPYPIFAYSALVPWIYFSTALTDSGNSLVRYEHVITKVYFPRLVVPIASVLAGLVDFAIAFVVLIGMLAYYGMAPSPAIVTLPFFLLLAAAAALGVGCWLAALNVQYRDIRYVIPFLVQIWLFCTPIAYPSSLVPERWRTLYGLNPMVGVVDGFRWALTGERAILGPLVPIAGVLVLVILITGLYYFQRVERTLADVV